MFLEFLTHTNSRILTYELHHYNSILIGRNLPAAQINLSIIFIVLYGITQDIHQKTLQMDWAAYKIFMNDLWCFVFHLDFSFISHLSNYIYHFIYYLIDIKRFLFQINFS